ncbi:MAG: metal ABC transporter ATP-binding protein [Actinobacteria bacterium]|nr:metal ABC transporter ATP-binding protein [Actinomycetota bacterium]MBW3646394.1 metal ABC transporter ATP-binding protein [Actinomycetota bacterium]
MTAPVIDLQDGSAGYDGRLALSGVDLRVEAGEVVAVLGANGSGKSTLVRALLGLLPLSSGRLALFGEPVQRFSHWPRIGYVPQRGGASTGVPATVREVVATGRLARTGLRPMRAADRTAITRAMDAVGLAHLAKTSVATLSGGQQQRVLIARALTCEPDLLVLDEPTAGVDAANQQALATSLGALVGHGATVLLVTHELGPMLPLITRAVTLADGRVLHDGPPPDSDHLHLHDHDHAHPVHDEVPSARGSAWGLR